MDELKKYAELCKAQQLSIDNYARVVNALKDDFDKLQGAVLAEREACAVLVEGGNHVHPKAPDAVWAKTIAKLIRARGNA